MENKNIIWKRLTIFGMVGVILYILHTVLGGLLWRGYSHLMQPISDLTASGAPNKPLLDVIILFYGISLLIFVFSSFFYLKNDSSKLLKVGLILLILMEIVSFSYNFFPQDLPNSAPTFRGVMHIVVTGLIVPLTISAPLFIGIGLIKKDDFKIFSIYSIATSAAIFIFGGLSVFIAANGLKYFGLFERINIGSLHIWIFLFSLKLFISKEIA